MRMRTARPTQAQLLAARLILLGLLALTSAFLLSPLTASAAAAEDTCASAPNPNVCENALPGDPQTKWQLEKVGDPTIQGFATAMSVNVGETEYFKINTPAKAYKIEILRLGYYGGGGAHVVTTVTPTASLPQTQPACLKAPSTGLIDCGNWGVSAHWAVPSNAISGIYLALLTRTDTGGKSQIIFVVRNDASHSKILLQTSDATWEAYNEYGGNSLYTCTVSCPPGEPKAYKGAFAVSYNRPFSGGFVTDGGASYLYYAEYQMMQWLEKNGYEVSYTTEGEVDRNPSLLENHKIFMSSGHDEYWSAGQRAGVEAAREAGVNLAFFSGNEIFWKTRWGPSTEGTETPYRTLTTYKESHFEGPVDPKDPPTWTGTWRDPRSPSADGGKPENALSGQQFEVNAGTSQITVPAQYAKLRLWHNTQVASLQAGQTLTLAPAAGTLGYEWDEDVDNGFRPGGEFDLSSTTVTKLQTFTDYGTTINENGTGTHHLTLYRAKSGALVFGAGTVQWSWGLDSETAWEGPAEYEGPIDPNMEQFTVNLLAEMGSQPGSLVSGLVAATQSTNTTPPTSTITSPKSGETLRDGSQLTISGTATGVGGVVAGVEVSTDNGATWHPATLTTPDAQSVNWSYTWTANHFPATTIRSRAVDDSGNLETPSSGVPVKVSCPCSIWGSATPLTPDSGDPQSVEVGVKFASETPGTVTGVRFYKSTANTGAHIGSLWTASGEELATATFTNETASGWQQVNFSAPVQISANTTYVAAYLAPNGHYAVSTNYFYTPTGEGGHILNSPPLQALSANAEPVGGLYRSANGFFTYSTTSTFPTTSFEASNYWVDPVFEPGEVATTPGQVTNVKATAGTGSASLTWNAPSSGGAPTTYTITPYIESVAQPATTVTGTPPATGATVSELKGGSTYTFTVTASNSAGSGKASEPSNAVVPTEATVPTAPTAVTATAGNEKATLTWTAPSNGGSPITKYTVTPYVGSEAKTATTVTGTPPEPNAIVTGLSNGTSYTFKVTATNSIGTGAESLQSNAVTPAVPDTIFGSATPVTIDSGDTNSVELGVKFSSEVAGNVIGIRFYKATTNTGTHIGSLWSTTGTLLASATFTGESASGWQQVNFSKPVAIAANTTYVAAYLAPNGHYSDTAPGFATAGISSPPLAALANTVSANGVYTYSTTGIFPTSTYEATNYWVDVNFQPASGTAPGQVTNVKATAGAGSASLTWNAPTSGGAPAKYTITPYIGAEAQSPTTITSTPPATSATVTGLTAGSSYTFTVTASSAAGSGPASEQSNAVTPTAPPPVPDTIFGSATPATIDSGDTSPVELGVKFSSEVSGNVTGIRFYKATTNTGTHIGSLWTASGTLLASATFTGESASGWQQVNFSTPIAISANTTYVAAYLAPNGHYSDTPTGFSSGVSNPPLAALANSVSPDGVYAYTALSTFPSSTFNATNYWVDVDFEPAPPTAPGQVTNVSATAGAGSASLTWSAPSSGGAPTKYTITPYIGTTAQPTTTIAGSPPATSTAITGLTNGTSYTFTVTASNTAGSGPASEHSNAITPTESKVQDTIFGSATPATIDSGDTNSVELGVKFSSEVAGSVTGIRFYKASTNTATHIGSLWSASGTLLASATFTGESASGWQQVSFSKPVAIAANTTYVAAYLAPNGHYSDTPAAFASVGVSNSPLTALANTITPDGVYAYSATSTFPSSSFNATNYWVDVDFEPGS
jgi:Domain of unknown function (DUF4082)/Fibronectin type III domain/Bacterial Ig domain